MDRPPPLPPTGVLPGRGTVTVLGSAVLLAGGSPPRIALQAVGALEGADVDGEELSQRLLAAAGAPDVLGVAVRRHDAWVIGLGPGVRLATEHIGWRTIVTGPAARVLRGVIQLRLGLPHADDAMDAAVAATNPGTRSGAGVVIQVEETVGQAPVSVSGVVCLCGAFVHPMTVRCIACRQLIGSPRRIDCQRGVPVGRIVLDDGRALPLQGSVVIGREPAAAGIEGMAVLALPDSERSMSRAHAILRLQGWDVVLEDRQAANGTSVRPASSGDWTVLVPGSAVGILPGTQVQLGRRTFRLVS